MGARPVRISLDQELLRRIDRDPEAKEQGRSAFVRRCIEAYFKARERREIDESLRRAYAGKAEALHDEFADFVGVQAWTEDE